MPALEDPQAEIYAQHYAIHRNQKRANEAAGFPPYMQLATRRDIGNRIKELWGIALEKSGVSPESVIEQLRRFAFPDVRRVFDEQGNLLSPHELDDETASRVTGIDVETRYEKGASPKDPLTAVRTTKIRFVDPTPNIKVLAQHLKLVGEEGEGVNALAATLADRLNRARERAYGSRVPAQPVEEARIIEPARIEAAAAPQPTLGIDIEAEQRRIAEKARVVAIDLEAEERRLAEEARIMARQTQPAKPFRSRLAAGGRLETSDEQLW